MFLSTIYFRMIESVCVFSSVSKEGSMKGECIRLGSQVFHSQSQMK